jgi:hypothetical protein
MFENQLGSEPGVRFTPEPGNSIVERAADAVDVIDNNDPQQGLSAATPSMRRQRVSFQVPLSAPWGAAREAGKARVVAGQ